MPGIWPFENPKLHSKYFDQVRLWVPITLESGDQLNQGVLNATCEPQLMTERGELLVPMIALVGDSHIGGRIPGIWVSGTSMIKVDVHCHFH